MCDSRVPLFLPFGRPLRWGARCPRCGSLERHRLLALYLRRERFLGGLGRVLAIGPFSPVSRFLKGHATELVTLDLNNPLADVRAPIEALPFPDATFDTIECSHVLEHVTDDMAGLAEMRRVLTVGGSAMIQVPFFAGDGPTDEDPSVVAPEERRRRFGQHDHVRAYGRDFPDRLAAAGFAFEQIGASTLVADREARRLGLADDILYHATAG